MKIAVVGFGYVGLPLALQFARSRAKVLGSMLTPRKFSSSTTVSYYTAHRAFCHCRAGQVQQVFASTDFGLIKEVEVLREAIRLVGDPFRHLAVRLGTCLEENGNDGSLRPYIRKSRRRRAARSR